jgi:hypothetical protein
MNYTKLLLVLSMLCAFQQANLMAASADPRLKGTHEEVGEIQVLLESPEIQQLSAELAQGAPAEATVRHFFCGRTINKVLIVTVCLVVLGVCIGAAYELTEAYDLIIQFSGAPGSPEGLQRALLTTDLAMSSLVFKFSSFIYTCTGIQWPLKYILEHHMSGIIY